MLAVASVPDSPSLLVDVEFFRASSRGARGAGFLENCPGGLPGRSVCRDVLNLFLFNKEIMSIEPA